MSEFEFQDQALKVIALWNEGQAKRKVTWLTGNTHFFILLTLLTLSSIH